MSLSDEWTSRRPIARPQTLRVLVAPHSVTKLAYPRCCRCCIGAWGCWLRLRSSWNVFDCRINRPLRIGGYRSGWADSVILMIIATCSSGIAATEITDGDGLRRKISSLIELSSETISFGAGPEKSTEPSKALISAPTIKIGTKAKGPPISTPTTFSQTMLYSSPALYIIHAPTKIAATIASP